MHRSTFHMVDLRLRVTGAELIGRSGGNACSVRWNMPSVKRPGWKLSCRAENRSGAMSSRSLYLRRDLRTNILSDTDRQKDAEHEADRGARSDYILQPQRDEAPNDSYH